MGNLAIGKKLLVCFGALLLAFIGVGGLAIFNLGTLAESTRDVGVERRAKLEAAAIMNTAASDLRVAEAYAILATDPAHNAEAEALMNRQWSVLNAKIAWFQPRTKLPETRALLDRITAAADAYRDASNRMLAFARVDKNNEALALFRGDRARFDAMSDTIDVFQTQQSKVMDKRVAAAEDSYRLARAVIIVAIVAVVGLCIAMLWVLARGIATPVAQVTVALGALARGDRSARVETGGRRDEIGQLGGALEGLRAQLSAADEAKEAQARLIVSSIGDGLDALARGDLTYRVEAELSGPFAKLKTDFNAALDSLGQAMGAFSEAANAINSGSAEIRQASEDLSNRTEQQAASLEETSAALAQVTATVRRAAEDALRANQAVQGARSEAEHSGDIVRRAVEAMSGIERSSKEISDIISVIDGIAFQTNLLALNAGVEAARAGDAGKGFAVVASEVRALAQRSAEAAKDIKGRIEASTEQVGAGVELVTETGRALDRIVSSVGEISGLMQEIADSSEKQSAGLTQVNAAVSEMDSMTQQNAAMAEEATAAARSLAGQSGQLAAEVGNFTLGDGATGTIVPLPTRRRAAPARAARPPQPRPAVARAAPAAAAAATAMLEDDWTEF
ncbi:HAMP domain-containing methyl-accepting chemotaxis protein [Sphingomonas morindae]|uniref:Methyl-accepting chemotaxis protein n=1 Tax=Sphingomonas morindae TaxID=1541170 RepID=A0ABY4X465_9SPHN|nr:methyl-accepting chemotaxis protein [Sphingomonas morindae]USI71691.1 methyl-accepting chemotaxis protein [Sphingomonas morindae]